jgi:hypothetical protein
MVRSPFGHDLIESRPAISTRASFPEELRGLSEKHRCKSAPGKFDAGIFKVRVPREGFTSTPCEVPSLWNAAHRCLIRRNWPLPDSVSARHSVGAVKYYYLAVGRKQSFNEATVRRVFQFTFTGTVCQGTVALSVSLSMPKC